MPPAVFSDVKDPDLRHRNRGAILANIFERYTTESDKGKFLQPKDFKMCTRDMDEYLQRMPQRERGKAIAAMRRHLNVRGYVEA